MDPPGLTTTLQVVTIASILAVGWRALRADTRGNAEDSAEEATEKAIIAERLRVTAETTQKIQSQVASLTSQNSDAHSAIHGRFDKLPCTTHASEISHLKGRLNGRRNGPKDG